MGFADEKLWAIVDSLWRSWIFWGCTFRY